MNAATPAPIRLFVGLKIAPDIASQLARLAARLADASVRRVAPADLHLTLVPPWDETTTAEAVNKLRFVADGSSPFWLTFDHLGYGPEARRPRLLWASCVASRELVELRTRLLEGFERIDEKPFKPHVTLARIRGKGRSIARRYPIDQELSLAQRIESIELFRSPPPGERGYCTLASIRLSEATSTTKPM